MLRKLLITAAAIAFTTGAAHATIVSGTATFNDLGPASNKLSFTGIANNSALSNLDLSLNTPTTLTDFLTISSHDTNKGSKNQIFVFSSETDQIATDFAFTSPSTGTDRITGSGTETLSFLFGALDGLSGNIYWEPSTVNFSDGATLQIALGNASFNPCAGPDQVIGVDATFTLLQAPVPVPEPGSLTLLGTGLLGLYAAMRRRRPA